MIRPPSPTLESCKTDASLVNVVDIAFIERRKPHAINFIATSWRSFYWTLSFWCEAQCTSLRTFLFFAYCITLFLLIWVTFSNFSAISNFYSTVWIVSRINLMRKNSHIYIENNNCDMIKCKQNVIISSLWNWPSPLANERGRNSSAFQLPEPIPLWIRCARKSRGEMRRSFADNVDQPL